MPRSAGETAVRGANRGGPGAYNRRGTPKVKDGVAQRKNRTQRSTNIYTAPNTGLRIDRRSAQKGRRHLLDRHDIERFIAIIPNWSLFSRGLNAIVLAEPRRQVAGWHQPGVLHVCPWDEELWADWETEFFEEHASVLDQLAVPIQRMSDEEHGEYVRCFFDEDTAKAWQLLHIFLHELGHHVDRMTTKKQIKALRGEAFAEDFALRIATQILPRYIEVFRPSFARSIAQRRKESK